MKVDEGFRLHPKATQDIFKTWEFIDASDPFAALRFVEEILDTIWRLVPFPHQGHRRSDLTARTVRFQTVREYLIAYTPDEKPLVVLAVFHGRRNPRVIAAMLRTRPEIEP